MASPCSLPNFSLAGAIDVLTLGKYPRLPTCIRDNIVPLLPLSIEENLKVCRQLEHVIQQRLASSHLPQQFLKNMKIGKCFFSLITVNCNVDCVCVCMWCVLVVHMCSVCACLCVHAWMHAV